jgi:hypothetical protein
MINATVPNPGSRKAVGLGCECPIAENLRGLMPPLPDGSWWVSDDCHLHRPWIPTTQGEADQHGLQLA